MAKKMITSLVALSMFGIIQNASAEEALKLEFRQIHGTRPQPALIMVEADMTPVARKQLDKCLAEGGMLETATFKQEGSAGSSLYDLKLTIDGKTHEARIDENQAPPAYTKLIKLIQKYGHKPPSTETASDEEKVDAAKADEKPTDKDKEAQAEKPPEKTAAASTDK